jgi:hypothetical protein
MLLLLSLACAPEPDLRPVGMPLEIDVGTYSVRTGSPTGPIVAVVVVKNTGTDTFTEDWFLAPAGASGTYAPYVKPSATNPTVVLNYVYASSSTAVPPTNPAPAPSSIRWKHAVTKQ